MTSKSNFPNLAGIATQDLVEKIGSGRFEASYINWSRTLNLLREHAPGWCVQAVSSADGSILHRAPVGGYLLIRFQHEDGRITPEVPQAVMDNRNAAIPFDKITSRDITDTHRRGACLAAAMTFGLGYELWAKMPLESGYDNAESDQAPTKAATREDFLEAALQKGLTTFAAEALLKVIGTKYEGAIKTLASKNAEWVAEQNAANQEDKPVAKKTAPKADPSEY
jgi:hypothetical protein